MEDLLLINTEQLVNAASDYEQAQRKYSTGLDSIVSDLEKTFNLWKDATTDVWQAKIKTAKESFETVNQRLILNSTVLKEVSNAACETEKNVKEGINSLG